MTDPPVPSLPPCLTIRLFGPFEIEMDHQPVHSLRARKDRWLLALLTLAHGKPVSRVWLAQTLWPFPETLESAAAYNLRRSLSALRKTLGAQAYRVVCPTPETVALDLTGIDADLIAFDHGIACGNTVEQEQAIARYRGPLLPECSEAWIVLEREKRQQAYLKALEELAQRALAGNDGSGAIRYLRLAISVDPLRETAQRALIRALADQGDYAAALQTYTELVRSMQRLEPPSLPHPQTAALYERVRAEGRSRASIHPVPVAKPSRVPLSPLVSADDRLPHPLTELIGREETLMELLEEMQHTRLLTLTGAGGMGKTRLAIAAAKRSLERNIAGVWFIELAGLSDANSLARVVMTALEIPEQAHQPALQTLTDALRPRAALLVLDNCEHLWQRCAELIQQLLRYCPTLRILTTSRRPLGIVGETVWRVPPLTHETAVQLFVARASAIQGEFRLTPDKEHAVAQICRRLEGIPLAIEMAAARIKALPAEQIAVRLSACLDLLTTGDRTALPRQQTLRATLDWSYALLTPQEQTFLNRLSVFAGGAALETLAAVCDPCGSMDVLNLLTSLIDQSLINYEERNGQPRYRLLETVRHYAQERLIQTGEQTTVRRLHRDVFLHLGEAAQEQIEGPNQQQWLIRLEVEHDNLRAALDHCCTDPDGGEPGLRLTRALWRFWQVRGYSTEGSARYSLALAHPGAQAPNRMRADALHAAGSLAWRQGDPSKAHRHYAESLTIRRAVQDRRGIAESLAYIGTLAAEHGCFASARWLNERSLTIYREEGDKRGMADAMENVGHLACDQEDYAAACRMQNESLALKRELGDRRGIANSLGNLGAIAFVQHDYSKARDYWNAGLKICYELDYKHGIINNLGWLGRLASLRDDFVSARAFLNETLAMCRQSGDRRNTSFEDCAALALKQGRHISAARLYAAETSRRHQLGMSLPYNEPDAGIRVTATLRQKIGDAVFEAAWAEGLAMSWEEAVEYALADNEQLNR